MKFLLFLIPFIALAEDHRTTITKVQPDSPSAKADLKPGDILIEVDGITKRHTESQLFGVLLQRYAKPAQLDATVLRNGKTSSSEISHSVTP